MVGIRQCSGRMHATFAFAFLLAVTTSGCFSSSSNPSPAHARSSTTHTVVAGETVYRIAQNYGVSVGRLLTANGMTDPRELHVGQVLVIPGGYQTASLGGGSSRPSPFRGARESRQFSWPVSNGVVSSAYGIRNGAMHNGVDISAPAGTPVHAADSGVVIFSGTLHGYGNTVIIRHDDRYATVYGHNEVNMVREGQNVTRGQTIAQIGRTGRTTGANLHFEVRRDNLARDPLAFLPEPEPASGISFAANTGG
ncbi:MAG TPA: M23 family metallopeptidase [Candidatus Binataceae bacterium]